MRIFPADYKPETVWDAAVRLHREAMRDQDLGKLQRADSLRRYATERQCPGTPQPFWDQSTFNDKGEQR